MVVRCEERGTTPSSHPAGCRPVFSGPYPHRCAAHQTGEWPVADPTGVRAKRCIGIFGDAGEFVKEFVSQPVDNLLACSVVSILTACCATWVRPSRPASPVVSVWPPTRRPGP